MQHRVTTFDCSDFFSLTPVPKTFRMTGACFTGRAILQANPKTLLDKLSETVFATYPYVQ